ncbi:MAG: hypothetical protein M3Z25_01660 [Actinomycetota bacterium]|nr:hypothetical protein [Actinomycetota bacterium]
MTTEGGFLRAARASLGWSQGQAAAELAALATQRGINVAAPSSLKTQLSRWENQHVIPEETYRILLCELYGRTDEELGLVPQAPADEPDEAELLRTELAVAAAVDDAAIDLLDAQLAATSALDGRLGSAAVAGSVRAQLSHLERVLTHAISPDPRRRLGRLVGAASMLAGQVANDRSLPASAWRHFERAKQVSHDAGDALLISWAMVEQSQLLAGIGREPAALELIQQAQDLSRSDTSPVLRAWFAANRGDTLASAGLADQARSAYLVAEQQLAGRPLRVDLGYPGAMCLEFDLAALYRHRGHGLHTLHDDEEAIADLKHALSIGGGSARDVAAVHVDLALAFSATDDPSSAQTHTRTARELTSRIGSTRLTTLLDKGSIARATPAATPS